MANLFEELKNVTHLGIAITAIISALFILYCYQKHKQITYEVFLMGSTGAVLSGTSIANGAHLLMHPIDDRFPIKNNEFYLLIGSICLIVVFTIFMFGAVRIFWYLLYTYFFPGSGITIKRVFMAAVAIFAILICLRVGNDAIEIFKLSWRASGLNAGDLKIPQYLSVHLIVGGLLIVILSLFFVFGAFSASTSAMITEDAGKSGAICGTGEIRKLLSISNLRALLRQKMFYFPAIEPDGKLRTPNPKTTSPS
jgi:hypothetical protein